MAVGTQAQKKELLLSINNFDSPATLDGINAAAKLLLNLLLMKKGTIVSSPDMGVHLIKYRFEEIDDNLLTKMKADIMEQTSKYLPDVLVDEMKIEHFAKNAIKIGFAIRAGDASGLVVLQVNSEDVTLSKVLAAIPRAA